MKKAELQAEALGRAVNGQTLSNYPAIFHGFIAKGIPEADIQPRVNIFTFQAWKALGRSVKKGEHGVKVITCITTTRKVEKEDGTIEVEAHNRPWSTTVFHISQTEVRHNGADQRGDGSPDRVRIARVRPGTVVAANLTHLTALIERRGMGG